MDDDGTCEDLTLDRDDGNVHDSDNSGNDQHMDVDIDSLDDKQNSERSLLGQRNESVLQSCEGDPRLRRREYHTKLTGKCSL